MTAQELLDIIGQERAICNPTSPELTYRIKGNGEVQYGDGEKCNYSLYNIVRDLNYFSRCKYIEGYMRNDTTRVDIGADGRVSVYHNRNQISHGLTLNQACDVFRALDSSK